MVKILCYGHGYISSNLMRVIVITYFVFKFKNKIFLVALIAQR
jgi:hypothetical protein